MLISFLLPFIFLLNKFNSKILKKVNSLINACKRLRAFDKIPHRYKEQMNNCNKTINAVILQTYSKNTYSFCIYLIYVL